MSRPQPASTWSAVVIVALVAVITALIAWSLSHPASDTVLVESSTTGSASVEPGLDRLPDVVIFLIDTLRADRLGTYGYPQPTSPHIDALAEDSVVFERAYAPSPWTLPSVVSLFTSTFPCEHGVLVDGQTASADWVTLAEHLRLRGYATASFHANPYAGKASGMDSGFERAELVPFVDETIVNEWLDTIGDRPFFLYAHNIEPHDPDLAPPRLIRLFGEVAPETCAEIGERLSTYRRLTRVDFASGRPPGTTDNTSEQIAAMERLAEHTAAISVLYDAAVRDADEKVGRVIEALKQRDRWDNTLFILLADHGEELGDHGGWQHDQSVYDELVRVPLIVRLPTEQGVRRRIPDVVSLVDVMPTILEQLGEVEACRDCSGRSLRRWWIPSASHSAGSPEVPAMRWNIKKYFRPYKETRGDLNVVVSLDHWKGIFNAEPRTLELYDLVDDAGERRNLAEKHPELAAALKLVAREWLEACRNRAAGRQAPGTVDFDAQQLERLRSLGYVE